MAEHLAASRRRRWTQPEQGAVWLLATVLTVSATLAVWLFTWVLFRKPAGIAVGSITLSNAASPVIPYRAEDAQALNPGRHGLLAGATSEPALKTALGDLARAVGGGAPLVIALLAVGIDHDGQVFLLPSDELGFVTGKSNESALISVDHLLEALRAFPDRRKFVILDASAIGSDRDLGVFGNGFVARLAGLLEARPVPNLVVLCSAGPGQTSHVSEADRCSVFGHFVALGLAGRAAAWDGSGRVTVQGLTRYVQANVRRWVESNELGRQTPVLLGDVQLNFPLRTIAAPRPPAALDAEKTKAVMDALQASWMKREALARRQPYRTLPVLWRKYQDGLLRAERLLRAGRLDEALSLLGTSNELASRIESAIAGEPLAHVWSIALSQRYAAALTDPQRKAIEAAAAELDRAVDPLVGGKIEVEATPTKEARPQEAPAKDAPATSKSAEDAKPAPPVAPSAPVPIARLELKPGGRIPVVVEGQLALWTDTYLKQPGSQPFEGLRGSVLRDAFRLRRLAEEAASVDARLIRRLDQTLAAADTLRRRGQDLLYAPSAEAVAAAGQALAGAEERYREVLAAADAYSRALNVVERLQAELPELGAWRVRHDRGVEPSFAGFLAEAEALGTDLARELGATAEGPELGRTSRALAERAQGVEAALERLTRDWLAEASSVRSQAAGPAKRRKLEEVLLVPLLPAELRMTLLEQLRGLEPQVRLDGRHEPEIPPVLDGETTVEPDPDPEFWSQAAGLGQIERTMLVLGGADPTQIDPLRSELATAESARSRSGTAIEAFGRFNKGVRAVRIALARRLTSGGDPAEDASVSDRSLLAADRAARVLPLPFLVTLSEENGPDRQLGRHLLHAHLQLLGRRLTEDFAPEHALAVLEDARRLLDTASVRNDLAAAQQGNRSALELAVRSPGVLTIGSQDAALSLRVTARGDLPAGFARAMFGYDPAQPLVVSENDTPSRSEPALLVPVPPAPGAERRFNLTRTAFSSETVRFDLRPGLFYRGRVFEVADPIDVVFKAAEEQVDVAITNPLPRWGDQFEDHPGRGYLHYGTTLNWRLKLTNKTSTPLVAWVEYGLDGEPTRTKVLNLDPGKPDDSIRDSVIAVDLTPVAPKTDAAAAPGEPVKPPVPIRPRGPNEVPLGEARFLSVVVRESGPTGRQLSVPRRFEFHQEHLSEYAHAQAQFDPLLGQMNVYIQHLPSDKVRGPIVGSAVVNGDYIVNQRNGQPQIEIIKGETMRYFRRFPFGPAPFPEKIPWSVDIGHKKTAFRGEEPTNVAPPVPPPGTPPKL